MAVIEDTAGTNTYSATASADTFVYRTGGTSRLAITGTRTGTISAYDTITNFQAGALPESDRIKFVNPADGAASASIAVAATITGTARSTLRLSSGSEVRSHSVSNGIISFSGSGTFSQATPLTSLADVAAAVQYLRLLDLGNAGATVAFKATIAGITHTYVFIQGTNAGTDIIGGNAQDVLIDLVGVDAVGLNFNASGIGIVPADAAAGPPPIQEPVMAAGLSFWGNDNTFPVEVTDAVAAAVAPGSTARKAPAATGSAEGGPSVAFISERGVEVQFFDNLGLEPVAGPEVASRIIVAGFDDGLPHDYSNVLMTDGVAGLAVAWQDGNTLWLQGIAPEGGLPFGQPVKIGNDGAHSLQIAGYDIVDLNNAPVASGINAVWVEGGEIFFQRYQIVVDPVLGNPVDLQLAGLDGEVDQLRDVTALPRFGSAPQVTSLHTGETVIVWLDPAGKLKADLLPALGTNVAGVDTVALADYAAVNARLDEIDNDLLNEAVGVEAAALVSLNGNPAIKVVQTGAGNFAILWVEAAAGGQYQLRGVYFALPPDTGAAADVVLPGGDGWTPIAIAPILLRSGFTGEFNLAGMGEDNPDIVLTYTADDAAGSKGVFAQHISGEIPLNAAQQVIPITVAAPAILVNATTTGNQTGGAVAGMVSDRAIITYTDDDGTVFTRIVDLRTIGPDTKGQYLVGDRIDDRNADGLLNTGDRVRGRPDVIVGTTRDDVIIGDLIDPQIAGVRFDDPQGDDDQLYGGLGKDYIFGGGGFDIIDGGNNLDTKGAGLDPTLNQSSAQYTDVALYLGNRLNTNITISGDGSYSVMDARFDDGDGFVDTLANGTVSVDGLDFVSNIEELWFLEGNAAPIRSASYASDLAAAIATLNGISTASKVITADLFHLPTQDVRLTGNVAVNADGTFTPGDTNPAGLETVLTPVAWGVDSVAPLEVAATASIERAPVVAALIEGFAAGWEVVSGGADAPVQLQMKVYDLLGAPIEVTPDLTPGVFTIDITAGATANAGSLAIAGTGVGTVAAWTEGSGADSVVKVQAFGLVNQQLAIEPLTISSALGGAVSEVSVGSQSIDGVGEQFAVAWTQDGSVHVRRFTIDTDANGLEIGFTAIGNEFTLGAGSHSASVTGLHDGEVAISYVDGTGLHAAVFAPGEELPVAATDIADVAFDVAPTIIAAGEGDIAVGYVSAGLAYLAVLPIAAQWKTKGPILLDVPAGAQNINFAVAGEDSIAVIVTWEDATGVHGQRFAYASDPLTDTVAGDKIGDVFSIATGAGSQSSGVAGLLDGRVATVYTQDLDANVEARIFDTRSSEQPEIGRDAGGPRDFMVGTVFDDIMDGRDRADILYGALGNDVLIGGTGDDSLYGGAGNDSLFGATGTDILSGEADNDLLQGGYGRDYIAGGAGVDTLSYRGEMRAVTVDLAAGTATSKNVAASAIVQWDPVNVLVGLDEGTVAEQAAADALAARIVAGELALEDVLGLVIETNHELEEFALDVRHGIENVEGGLGNDTIIGDANANVISGLEGDDDLRGGGGNDTLVGGAGNDTLNGNAGGADVAAYVSNILGVTLSNGSYVVQTAREGTDTLTNIEQISLNGAAFTIRTGAAGQTVNAGAGSQIVIGDGGSNTLNGQAGADILLGGAGTDTLTGGADNDILVGGAGNDTMNGNDGNDAFVFATGFGADRINGFDANPLDGQDLLDISAYGFQGLAGNVTVAASGSNTLITIGQDTITLVNVAASSIDRSDFIL